MSQFNCPICGFVQGYAIMRAEDGAVFDNPRATAHQPCPNDGAALEPVTETNGGKEHDDDYHPRNA